MSKKSAADSYAVDGDILSSSADETLRGVCHCFAELLMDSISLSVGRTEVVLCHDFGILPM